MLTTELFPYAVEEDFNWREVVLACKVVFGYWVLLLLNGVSGDEQIYCIVFEDLLG